MKWGNAELNKANSFYFFCFTTGFSSSRMCYNTLCESQTTRTQQCAEFDYMNSFWGNTNVLKCLWNTSLYNAAMISHLCPNLVMPETSAPFITSWACALQVSQSDKLLCGNVISYNTGAMTDIKFRLTLSFQEQSPPSYVILEPCLQSLLTSIDHRATISPSFLQWRPSIM